MPKREVLVVEDDSEINELICAYAQIAGFSVRSALNGASALQLATENPPSLVILDVMLPDTDGFNVCTQLRNMPQTRNVPVLMLTAMNREDCRLRGRECGAAEYMTKPFDPEGLIAAIKRHASHIEE